MDKSQKILRITIIAQAALTLIVPNLRFLIIKIGGYWMFFSIFLGFLFFIGLSIGLVLLIVRIKKHQQWRCQANYFTVAIALVFLCIYLFPYKIADGSTFLGAIKIRAYDEGRSKAIFRENGKFEIATVAGWGRIHYSTGNYIQKNDSLFLNFTQEDFPQEEKFHLGNTLVIKDSILYKIQNDILISTHYYLTDGKNPKK